MRDLNEYLLLLQTPAPATALGSTLTSVPFDVENSAGFTLAVKLRRSPIEGFLGNIASFDSSALEPWVATDSVVNTNIDLRQLGIRAGFAMTDSNSYWPSATILNITETTIEFSAGASQDYNVILPNLHEVGVPAWAGSTQEVTITYWAVLPDLTQAEHRHSSTSESANRSLLKLHSETITLNELALNGSGYTETRPGFSSVLVTLSSSATEWPMDARLVVWGLPNRQR